MNKKSEFAGACNCNTRFPMLYLNEVGGADEASCGCQKMSRETCVAELKLVQKGNLVNPKK